MFPKSIGKTALVFQNQPISYRTLLQAAAAFAAAMPAGRGERVVLFSENRPEWIYAFYAVWNRRAVCVPLDANLPPQALAAILDDCRPRLLICSEGTKHAVSEALRGRQVPEVMVIEEMVRRRPAPESLPPAGEWEPDLSTTAAILYTSGTTGEPKGVMLSYDNFLANIEAVEKLGIITKEDRLLSLLPFHHIFPLQANVILPLSLGATVILVASLEPQALMEALRKHRATVIIGVPRLYERIRDAILAKVNAHWIGRGLFRLATAVHHPGFSRLLFAKVRKSFGGRLRVCVSGGAKLDLQVARDLRNLGFTMLEGYGTTETAPLIAANPLERIKLGTVGPPIPGCEVKLAAGEIAVRGRNVMQGYYHRPDATSQVLRDGWYFTGDLGGIDSQGYLTILGRKDELIVLPNGKNIQPEEVEARLQAMAPAVKEAAVLLAEGRLTALIYPDFTALGLLPGPEALEKIKTMVVEPYNQAASKEKHILAVHLASEPFPRTRLGKLRRFALPGFLREEFAQPRPAPEPAFPEYRLLRDFLASLKSAPIRPEQRLEMDLGMDSLDKAELSAFSEAGFGVQTPESVLQTHPTVAQLAEHLRDAKPRLTPANLRWKEILSQAGPALRNRPAKIFFHKTLKNLLSRYFAIEYHGLDRLPPPPFIVAANHQSYLDAPAIAAVLPDAVLERTTMVMKEGVIVSRMVSLISRGNLLKINPEKDVQGVLQQAAAFLRRGDNILIFPEGRRTPDGQIAPFKRAFAILGKELQVPVVPAAVQGTYRLLPRGRFWPRRGRIRIDFLTPVSAEGKDYAGLAATVESEIKAQVAQSA